MTEKKERPLARMLLEASSVGLNLVISTFVGLAIGYWLDKFFQSSPYLTIIFLLLGIVAGFMELIRVAAKGNRKDSGT